jgi:predicted peptidase
MSHSTLIRTTLTVAIIGWGSLLMAETGDLKIEPGKQLPQSVTVHVGDKNAERDVTLRYLLFVPKNYKANGDKWPLLLFLHGLGECSNEDLNRVKIHGPAKIVEGKPDFPFILITPQCPPPPGYDPLKPATLKSDQVIAAVRNAWKPEELIALIDHVSGKLNVDLNRVYVTGLSMGGYGTWRLAAAYPDRFAAAVPICGGGEPDKMAKALSGVPIWAFHGAKDTTVPLTESKHMIYSIRQAGGDVRLTIYPDAAHNSWEETYNNPDVYDWLLAHHRQPK